MKECFILKEEVEQKIKLEDIIPLINEDEKFQYIFVNEIMVNLEPARAIAHLPDEMKNKIYRNMPSRIIDKLKKKVNNEEKIHKENSDYIQREKYKLRELLIFYSEIWVNNCPWNIVWKETEQNETEPQETLFDSDNDLIKQIELACACGTFSIHSYQTKNITVKDMQKAFSAFNNRRAELRQIRSLGIPKKFLSAAALLFEEGTIEELSVSDDFRFPWPPFLEKYTALKSINIYYKSTEFPSWIRNAVSLRHLSIRLLNTASIPNWIEDLQSLTEFSLGWGINENDSITLPDNICKLKNMVKLNLYGTSIEKLPDSIGNLQSLTELSLKNTNLKTLPDSIGNLKNLLKLELRTIPIEKLPDSIGELKSLKEISLCDNENLKTLPDSIGNLKNLTRLELKETHIEKLPDSIGDLQSLTELSLKNTNLKTLPDGIGNLKNLVKLELKSTSIETLPDSIGNLQSLTELSLTYNKNLKTLPDSIGNLKNLVKLELNSSPIEKLPDTIVNCSALEYVNICGTNITSVPSFMSSVKEIKKSIQLFPKEQYVSYRSFCNHCYRLVDTVIQLSKKVREEGILAIEDDVDSLAESFFKYGMRLVVDGTDSTILRDILTLKIDREHNFYRRILMIIAMEGVLGIQSGESMTYLILILASYMDIKNNPIDAACTEYLSGNCEALPDIDFESAIQPEEECEEVRFIKRAKFISKTIRKEGLFAIEKHLDHDGIAKRDIFEYGLPLVIDRWDEEIIDTILGRLVEQEKDPVRKNFALAKKEAVMSLHYDENTYIMSKKLCAYFDESIEEIIMKDID
jgi:Leucine-rich repeat (LRR) protein